LSERGKSISLAVSSARQEIKFDRNTHYDRIRELRFGEPTEYRVGYKCNLQS